MKFFSGTSIDLRQLSGATRPTNVCGRFDAGVTFEQLQRSQDHPPGSPLMRAFVLLVAFLIGLALPTLALPARAADDVATAQGVIRSQVEAFSRDDAATAYSYAAPAIHDMFPRADLFLFMVQQSYAPVYRHRSFEFGEARVSDGRIAQRVHIVDANGEAWEALYTLEQQPDGSVKIIGCVLLKAGQAV
jgi:hypothetical protein